MASCDTRWRPHFLFITSERTLTTTSALVTHTEPREAHSNLLRRILSLCAVHYLTLIDADIHPLELRRRSQSPLRRSVVRVSGHEQHTRQPSQRGFDVLCTTRSRPCPEARVAAENRLVCRKTGVRLFRAISPVTFGLPRFPFLSPSFSPRTPCQSW